MLKKILVGILASAMIFGSSYCYAFDAGEVSAEYNYIDKVSGFAAEMFIDETLTKEDIIKQGISKFLDEHPEYVEEILKYGFSSLDEYSEYYNIDDYRTFVNDINHTFYGIGVVIQKNGDYIEIVRCLDDGSAREVGIQAGDKISVVNGVDCKGKSIDEVQDLVVGELGSEVTITVIRGNGELIYTLERRPVSSETVYYSVLEGNIGYIEIINFAANTSGEFEKAIDELKDMGVSKIIIDLRDNPGGYLKTAVEIARLIVPKGTIVRTIYRMEEYNSIYESDLEEPYFEIVCLVNGNSASASEVLAGAIKDSGAGVLVGETTFGKGLVQEMIPLGDGSAFKLTTGKYLTRNGHDINGIGITPDHELANAKQPITTENYTQFDYKTKWKIEDCGEGVRAAKERLYLLGYNITTINDKFDQNLKDMVAEFQKDSGLFAYGVLDITTQVKMENEFAKLEETVDMQLAKAYTLLGGNKEDLYK